MLASRGTDRKKKKRRKEREEEERERIHINKNKDEEDRPTVPPKNTERPECLGAAENYCCKLSYSQILPHNSLLNWNCVALNPVRGSDPWVMFSLAGSGSISVLLYLLCVKSFGN